jgi:hypothetical protein
MRTALLLALATLAIGCGHPSPAAGPDGPAAAPIAREPAAAAAFVAAFALGDEAGADGVASPLYRYEWARRAISIEDRLAIVPYRRAGPPPSPEWIRFHFEGGLRDSAGFGHLIYSARPPAWVGDGAPSVWRIDVDAENRVIWCELVWLFSDGANQIQRTRARPPGVRAGTVVAGVRSTSGPEGYYALAPAGAVGQGDRPSAALFLAVGPEGGARIGAWSYGEPPSPGAGRARAAPLAASPELAAMRASYIDTL